MAKVPNFAVTKPEDAEQIAVGDRVRSYDFESSDENYADGIVEHDGDIIEGCARYRIKVENRVIDGIAAKSNDAFQLQDVFPPVNGTRRSFGGYTNGVRKLA